MINRTIQFRCATLLGIFLSGSLFGEVLTWNGLGNWNMTAKSWLDANSQEHSWIPGSLAVFKNAGQIFVGDALSLSGIEVGQEAEFLEITGGGLLFESPAVIRSANRLTKIDSALSAPNGLAIETRPGPSNPLFLAPGKEHLLFENVSLDEIQAIHGNFRGWVPEGCLPCQGFHFRREGDTLTVQMQVRDPQLIKAVLIALRQDGANIYGQAIKTFYIPDTFQCEGVDFESPFLKGVQTWVNLGSAPNDGYGISDLRLTLASGAVTQIGGELSSGQTLTNRLGKIEFTNGDAVKHVNIQNENGDLSFSGSAPFYLKNSLSGRGSILLEGNAEDTFWTAGKSTFLTMEPTLLFPNRTLDQVLAIRGETDSKNIWGEAKGYHFKRVGDVLKAQMQVYHGGFVKVIGIEISQKGPDLYVQAQADYVRYAQLPPEEVGRVDFDTLSGYGKWSLALGKNRDGYGIHKFELQFKGGSEVRMEQSSETLLSDSGTWFTPSYTIDDIDLTKFSAKMSGEKMHPQPREAVKVCFARRENDRILAQVQAKDGEYKCVWIEIYQRGGWLMARPVMAGYCDSDQEAGTLDFNHLPGGYTFQNVATPRNKDGYGVDDLWMQMTDGTQVACLKSSNTMTGSVKIRSGALTVEGPRALSNSSDILTEGPNSILELSIPEIHQSMRNTIYKVRNGAILSLHGRFNLGGVPTSAVELDNGILYTPLLSSDVQDCDCYMNQILLKNQSRVVGSDIRMGGGESALLQVQGSSPSVIDTGIIMVNMGNPLTIEVDDVTGDAAEDLTVKGGFRDFRWYEKLPITKTKAGTLRLEGVDSGEGAFEIQEGVVCFACRKKKQRPLVLNGGSIAVESDVGEYGLLNLKQSATISLDGGSIAFTDCSSQAWEPGAKLQISGTLGKESLRFGTNAVSLTSEQLSQIRYNGHRVLLSDQGYLSLPAAGSVLLLQ